MTKRKTFMYCCFVYVLHLLLAFNAQGNTVQLLHQRFTDPDRWQWYTKYAFVPGAAGWYRRTGSTPADTVSYEVCDLPLTSTKHTNSWLISEFIPLQLARVVNIKLVFIARQCDIERHPYCKEYFKLNAYEADTEHPAGVSKQIIEDGKFSFIGNVNASKTWESGTDVADNIVKLFFPVTRKGVYLGFQDVGSCISLKEVSVSYNYCPGVTTNGVRFNNTSSPLPNEQLRLYGRCMENSLNAVNDTQFYMECLSNGSWAFRADVGCLCLPGFEFFNGYCTACPAGTFKNNLGNIACFQCPTNTHPNTSRTTCECNTGYYQTEQDPTNGTCYTIPSEPRNLNFTYISGELAVLAWQPPLDTGGRNDVMYNVTCFRCDGENCTNPCGDLKYAPARNNIVTTAVTVIGLSPSAKYNFKVYSGNGVSALAGNKRLRYSVVSVLTDKEVCPELCVQNAINNSTKCDENQCPVHSRYNITARACVCDPGYYTMELDSSKATCFGLPGKPRSLTVLRFSQTSVTLAWQPPNDTDRDVVYDITCTRCDEANCNYACDMVEYVPSKDDIAFTAVTVSGLFPSVTYIFKVFSKSGVINITPHPSLKFAAVTVRTKKKGCPSYCGNTTANRTATIENCSTDRDQGCPAHTHMNTDKSVCVCDEGYYRTQHDPPNGTCFAPPSSPLNLSIIHSGEHSIVLAWQPPSDPGGRYDISYGVTCLECNLESEAIDRHCNTPCHGVQYTPTNVDLIFPAVTIFELLPFHTYLFDVHSVNGVSRLAGPQAGKYAEVIEKLKDLAVGPNSNKSKQVFSQREYATIAMATGATLFLMSIVMLVINIHLRRRWYKAALRARCSHAEKLSNLTVPSLFESPHGSLQMEELLNRYDIDISTYDRRTSLKYAHRPNPSAKP